MTTTPTRVDRDGLATELADLLPKYGLEADARHVQAALDNFLADIQGYAQEEDPAT